MADVAELAKQVEQLLVGVAGNIYNKFNAEDKANVSKYAGQVADLTLKRAAEGDPAKQAVIDDDLQTYKNAMQFMLARYEIAVASDVEAAALKALKLAVETIVKLIIVAVTA